MCICMVKMLEFWLGKGIGNHVHHYAEERSRSIQEREEETHSGRRSKPTPQEWILREGFERFDFGRCGLDLSAEWNRTPPSVCARYLNCTQIKNVAWAVGGENGDLTGLLYAFVFRTADVANLFIISPRKVLHSYPAISNDRVHSKMEQAVCTLKAHKCSVLKTLMSHLYNELNA